VLQEHKSHSQVKTSPLRCCAVKSAAQIYTELRGSQLTGDLSGVLAICPQCWASM